MQTLQQLQQELAGKEAETLYILGNGFDLYHGLESRYSDFRGWLMRNATTQNGYKEFVDGMERLFPLETKQDMLWSNFEAALGKYDLNLLSEEFNEAHGGHSEDKMRSFTHNVCSQIRQNMSEWAAQLPVNKVKKLLNLNESSLYLTFNYTRVLEDVYCIPEGNICHIHGDTNHKYDVITGHDWEYHYPDRDNESDIIKAETFEEFNGLLKNPQEQISKHSVFFSNLSKIKHVVVIGHSLQNVDKKYFTEVSKSISPNAQWHFCTRLSKDRFAIYEMRSELGTSVELAQKDERYFTLSEGNGRTFWKKISDNSPYIYGVAFLTVVPLFVTWILMKVLPASSCGSERMLWDTSLSWFDILSFCVTFFGLLYALLNFISYRTAQRPHP